VESGDVESEAIGAQVDRRGLPAVQLLEIATHDSLVLF